MSLISIEFFALVGITFIFYWIISSRFRWVVLLISSAAFVWLANGHSKRAVVMMYGMIIIAYIAGVLFEKTSEKIKRAIFVISLIIEAVLLIRMKDFGFFTRMFGREPSEVTSVILIAPLGVSYFTLSLIGYICDTYWCVQQVEKNPFKFMLFGSYFPLLTSGPIVKYSEIGTTIFEEKTFSYKKMCFGAQRILWGVFKKLVISERVTVLVNTIYGNPEQYPGLYVWIAVALFVLQLYTDFSGCIDIIMGVSELFGVDLPENFNLPFTSTTLAEFWRRWHITLGNWLKDYVFYPVLKSEAFVKLGEVSKKAFGKKKGKKVPTYLGLFITWFLIGFWHGGSWNYIVGVGLWMWFIIVLSDLLSPALKKLTELMKINTECFSWHLFQYIRTFLLFMVGNGLFRASSLKDGIYMYKMGLSVPNIWILFDQSFLNLGLSAVDLNILFMSVLLILIAGIIRERKGVGVRVWMSEQNLVFRWIVWLGLFVIVLIYGKYGPGYSAAEFIYKGF